MKYFLHILLPALLLPGCEKDPVIPEKESNTLSSYLRDFDETAITDNVWAQAGNHPSFEKETDGFPVHVIFHVPDSAHSFVYFESDSLQFPDSLQFFHQKNAPFEWMENRLLGRFLTKTPKHRKLARVGFQLGDSLYVSAPVLIRDRNTETENIETVNIGISESGRAFFDWQGVSTFSVEYLVLLSDRTGEAFCGVYTSSRSFIFYDLRNVHRNLTPSLFDPLLVTGEEYTLNIYGIDEDGWIRDFTHTEFKAVALVP